MNAMTYGLDISKRVFQLYWVEEQTGQIFNRRFDRIGLIEFLTNRSKGHVALEACGSGHWWARKIESLGHSTALLHEENRQPLNAQIAVLLRAQKSPQPSWAALVLAAKWMATVNPVQARQFIEQQFAAFEKSPRTVPDMIGFYTDSMQSPILALGLNTECMVSNPRYRQACADRALTEEGRQKVKAYQEGRVEAMGNRLGEKLGKAFGVKP